MKILIFGGSFDPPHRGHAALLLSAAKTVRPERILIIPAYHAPLKDNPSAPAPDRLRMLRLSLLPALPKSWRGLCRIDLAEMRSHHRVYTVDTLKRLSRLYPKAELHFVVGSDSAASFPFWKNPGLLKKSCAWWTGNRPGPKTPPPSHFKKLPGPMPDISSTEIRRALARGQDVSGLVAAPVLAHIKKRGLYGLKRLAALKKSLSPGRYEHTLAVAALAGELARRWNFDGDKALLAALLHDCGRAVPVSDMPAYARKRGLSAPAASSISRHNPLLLHAYISEDLARRRFGVSDSDVLSAIRKHTLGGRPMSPFDRLLYVADALAYDRGYAGVLRLRKLAFSNLNSAFAACLREKIEHVRAAGAWMHPLTLSTWKGLKKR